VKKKVREECEGEVEVMHLFSTLNKLKIRVKQRGMLHTSGNSQVEYCIICARRRIT
jgi:hypothetical protein